MLWHCWLGHLIRKNPSPIWPVMCLWDIKPYSTSTHLCPWGLWYTLPALSTPLDNIWPVIIVWRTRVMISELFCAVLCYTLCTVTSMLIWAVLMSVGYLCYLWVLPVSVTVGLGLGFYVDATACFFSQMWHFFHILLCFFCIFCIGCFDFNCQYQWRQLSHMMC